MSFLIKYLFIYPLLALIDLIDFIIGLFKPSDNTFKNLPQSPPYTVQVDKSDPKSAYRSVQSTELLTITDPKTNLYSEFVKSVVKNKNVKTLGVRDILSVEDQVQQNGKVFKKYNMAKEFRWTSYEDLQERVDNLANGLLKLGLKSNDKIVIYSETRAEWLVSALACFKIKVTIVTLYATLGLDALAYGVNETNASFLIASGESILNVQKIFNKIPKISHAIVLTDKITEQNATKFKTTATHVNVLTCNEVENLGKASEKTVNYETPSKDDIAVIMYTSGSTGNPKGVMITHANFLSSFKVLSSRLGEASPEDTYIAYLPLAHVLELVVEIGVIMLGVPVGYSSPLTLSDNSTAIKAGELGDLRVLKPTLMVCVPAVLERLSKIVKDKLTKMSFFKRTLIELASEKKLKKFQSGQCTVFLNRIIFSKISNSVFGGRLKFMVCGGAYLNKEVHEFGQTYFCSVIQTYGLTEICGGGTVQYGHETATEECGSVVESSEIKLVDWPEGNYRCTDKPNPRGEVWIGGDNVTMGYYNMPEKTKEDFHYINGVRYFSTGDIAEMLPNGNLKIVDRKKDLVKLQSGEYVSLNKIESVIKLVPFVDNCCVVADGRKSNCVCLLSPNLKQIEEFVVKNNIELKTSTEAKDKEEASSKLLSGFIELLEKDDKLQEKFNKEIVSHCLKQGLERFEIPTKAIFVKEAWMPGSGLVTDSLKLKRREIEKFYQQEIESIFN